MKKLAFTLAVFAVLAGDVPVQAEEVKLLITNACTCTSTRNRICKALNSLAGAKVKDSQRLKGPIYQMIVDVDTTKVAVGDLAKTLANTEGLTLRMRREEPPPVETTLVFAACELTASSDKKLQETLKDVKGVDAPACTADLTAKEIRVRLNNAGGAKLADIQKALKSYTHPPTSKEIAEK